MKRRDFLNQSLCGSAALIFLPSLLARCGRPHDPLHDIGIITNVVHTLMKEDHRATMELLAEMGYKYLEFGGTFGEEPAELLGFMKGIGLLPLAGGTSIHGLQGDGLKQMMDDCLQMEKKYLVCYWPWMDGGEHPSLDQVRFATEEFNRMGEQCKASGLRFAFHNHDKEFSTLDGKVIYEYFLEDTDPDLVCMEIDLYWAFKGGARVSDYFNRYPGRFELVHVKDSYESESRQSFAPVGSGIIDFPEIFGYRDVAGFRHLIVEHDKPGPENEESCARSSIEYLKSLRF